MFEMIPFRRNNSPVSKRGDYFDQFFKNFFNDDFFAPVDMTSNIFEVDLKEDKDAYMIEADLPGIKKDAIDIEYDNNYLTISAKRDDTVEDKNENYIKRERRYGEFRRIFYVDNVIEDEIDAEFKNGVLKITLPKHDKVIEEKKKIDIR